MQKSSFEQNGGTIPTEKVFDLQIAVSINQPKNNPRNKQIVYINSADNKCIKIDKRAFIDGKQQLANHVFVSGVVRAYPLKNDAGTAV